MHKINIVGHGIPNQLNSVLGHSTLINSKRFSKMQYYNEINADSEVQATLKRTQTAGYHNNNIKNKNVRIISNSLPIHEIDSKCFLSLKKKPEYYHKNVKISCKKSSSKVFTIKPIQKVTVKNINNDLLRKQKYGNLKQLWKFSGQMDITLILSVDLIINELNFWKQQQISRTNKYPWKILQQHCNLVWIITRQNTYEKLIKFTKQFDLRIDGIYIKQLIKSSILISYQLIQKNITKILKKHYHKIIIVCGIRTNDIYSFQKKNFILMLPLINHLECSINLIQIDINNNQRFKNILKILNQSQTPKLCNLESIFNEIKQKQNLKININIQTNKKKRLKKQQSDQYQFDIYDRIQQLRKQYFTYFTQQLGLNIKQVINIQNNINTLQYIIGDMLKRNYKLIQDVVNYQNKSKQKIKNQFKNQNIKKKKIINSTNHENWNSLKKYNTNRNIIMDKFCHNRSIFLWKF